MGVMMALDLLPEKYSPIKHYKADGICVLLAFIVPFCILMVNYAMLTQQQTSLQERIQRYQDELQSLNAIHNPDDITRLSSVSLQATLKLWQSLDKAVGRSACLTDVHRYKKKITMSGRSQSIQRIKDLNDVLMTAHLFKTMSIARVTTTKKQGLLEFTLHADERDD
jgi:hypothetical protein